MGCRWGAYEAFPRGGAYDIISKIIENHERNIENHEKHDRGVYDFIRKATENHEKYIGNHEKKT